MNFVQGDFFDLSTTIEKDQFDLVFHSGVLEHFDDDDIRAIVGQQLAVAKTVIFTVPIASAGNSVYFDDDNFRRLMPIENWLDILYPFCIEKAEVVKGRHDDLLAVITRE